MSKRVEHTPGPWEVKNSTDVFTPLGHTSASGITTDDSDGWHIADCNVGPSFVGGSLVQMSYAERMANARLIRAAPDLLEVAKIALLYAVSTGNDLLANMAGSAITKVEGEQQ